MNIDYVNDPSLLRDKDGVHHILNHFDAVNVDDSVKPAQDEVWSPEFFDAICNPLYPSPEVVPQVIRMYGLSVDPKTLQQPLVAPARQLAPAGSATNEDEDAPKTPSRQTVVRQTRSVAKRQQAAASVSTQASAPGTPHRQAVNKRRKNVGEGSSSTS